MGIPRAYSGTILVEGMGPAIYGLAFACHEVRGRMLVAPTGEVIMATVGAPPVKPSNCDAVARGCPLPGPVYRYHAGGNLVLGVGIVVGIVTYSLGVLPPWAGFLAGAGPAFVLTALAYTIHDA